MKARNIEDNLVLLAALIVLVGVSFAAQDALAKDHAKVTSTAVAIHNAADHTLDGAEAANTEAAALAMKSLAQETMLDLDIKLEDRRSSLFASDR